MRGFEGEIHPLADRYPMLSEDELYALADDIATNGLHNPITVSLRGVLVDGRNRLRACELAGVDPLFSLDASLDTEDKIAAFITSANSQRRNQTTGQKAMAVAEQLAAEGKRKNGRWSYGSIQNADIRTSDRAWIDAMRLAGLVLDYTPDIAIGVIGGQITLNDAATQAEAVRDAAESKAAAEAKLKKDLEKLRQLRPDLADKVELGDLTATDALKVIADDIAAEEKAERDRLGWIEKLCTTLTDAISAANCAAHDNNRRDLIDNGLLTECADGRSVEIHDYLEHQTSRQQVIDVRTKRAQAGRKGGANE